MNALIQLVATLIDILGFAVLARALLSWFPINPGNPVVGVLVAITEPILEPLRKIVPRIGMLDITPMVAMIMLFFIGSMLHQMAV